MIITFKDHYRKIPNGGKIGYCVKGGRRWLERYGLSWNDFIHNGLPEEAILATNDALGINLVKYAHSLINDTASEVVAEKQGE